MEVNELKLHIMNKSPEKFYIFTGPEWKIQQIYIQKMSEAFNCPYKYVDSLSSIYSKLCGKSFVKSNYMYVIRDDNDILTNEKVQSTLESVLGDNILVLLLTNVDKRTKFYKKFADKICIFDYLSPIILQKYIEKEISLGDTECQQLIQVCENDYGRCLLEIDKIKRYQSCYKKDLFCNDAFNILLKEGAIYTPPKDAIFEFVDAILDCNKNAFDLYEDCKKVNEAVMVMLTVLYNNTKAVLQVQSYHGNDVCKATGLTSFQVMNAKKHINKRRNGDLIYIMRLCQQCQEGIVTGTMEEEFVMDYILGEIM